METIECILGIGLIVFCIIVSPAFIVLLYCITYDIVKDHFEDYIENLKEKIKKWLS